MPRIRKVFQWGHSLVILLNKVDKRELGIEPGDEVDIEKMTIIKLKKGKK